MISELYLNHPHQKMNIKILGGGDRILYTSVPSSKGQAILLSKYAPFNIHVFNDEFFFRFKTSFKNISTDYKKIYYIFEIIKVGIEINKRKENREITDIPLMIEISNMGYQIGKALDISKTGIKLSTKQPLNTENIILHFQTSNGIKKIPSSISWESRFENTYYYGIQFNPAS